MKSNLAVRILILDDDPSVASELSNWLTAAAFDVTICNSADDAVERLSGRVFDLALVDLRLPNSTGAELVELLHMHAPQLSVLGLVAFPENTELAAALEAGAADVLVKPLKSAAVIAKIDEHLADLGIPARTERAFNQRLGARLRAARKALRLAQQDVATIAQITPAQLSQIEHGKTATTTWTLARISAALRLRLDDLFAKL